MQYNYFIDLAGKTNGNQLLYPYSTRIISVLAQQAVRVMRGENLREMVENMCIFNKINILRPLKHVCFGGNTCT